MDNTRGTKDEGVGVYVLIINGFLDPDKENPWTDCVKLHRSLAGQQWRRRLHKIHGPYRMLWIRPFMRNTSTVLFLFVQVIFRSCKLIPTMMIAVLWRKKVVGIWEFVAAAAVCAGLIVFARADAKLEPDFNPIGIAMVMLSVCADAFLPNVQVGY